jgi:hypothetical protein
MHRLLMIVALLGALVAGGTLAGVAGTAAHDGTPHASQSNGDSAAGDPVTFVNEQGDEVAQITVEEIIDPFDDYEEGYEPERGARYAAVRFTIEATGEDPVPVSSSNFSLQDSQGFWLGTTTVTRTAEQESEAPPLEDTELAPGDSASGLLTFIVFEENAVDQIIWQPTGDRLITLADAS